MDPHSVTWVYLIKEKKNMIGSNSMKRFISLSVKNQYLWWLNVFFNTCTYLFAASSLASNSAVSSPFGACFEVAPDSATFEEEVEDAFGTSDLEDTGTSEVDIETNLASMFSHSVFMIFPGVFLQTVQEQNLTV